MSGGKAAPVETSRLEQPNDAVAMENIAQSSEQAPADHAPESADKTVTTEPAPSTAVPATSENTDNSAATAAASSKGKEKDTAPPPLPTKQDSNLGIGPAVDDIREISGIDAKYLSRRSVDIPDQTESGLPDPFSISVYTLKELILREWRSDWEAKPASPSSIRLIHFGKLLDDKEQLKKYQLSTESPNVVHMSIRPQDLDEEEPKAGNKNLSSSGGDGQRSRDSNCCIIL
ncbi:UBL3-like, ubiquitin domain [Fusarium oxysporum f. sp. vasinfectum]|nr:UBL3-like, ubiquitin domain [Fusarium oxysporum f. sp. vasinfectum]